MKGSRVVFTHREGISTPHVRPKGRQPLIECANMTLIFMFPFYVFISFIPFLYFSLFVVDKGVSLCSYVFLNLGWENQTYVVLLEQSVWFKFVFCLFCKICFYWTKGLLRCWTIKRSFDFERRETLRRWTINDLLFLKGEKR